MPHVERPVALIILDGWGIGRDEPGNAIHAASTPVMDHLLETCPNTLLVTSGLAVGLPDGQMGNSEVGHLNIGAGFIVYQWISRIDKAIAAGELAANKTLLDAIDKCVETGTTLHIGGLISDGGVHSHTRHIEALARIAVNRGLDRIVIHAFTDGRDTSPASGLGFVSSLDDSLRSIGAGRIATVCGRYYAMDRDKRWERTKRAYDLVVSGLGEHAETVDEAIQRSYDRGVTDEFIEPAQIGDRAPLLAGDAFLFANFRSDRGRQLTEALASPDFSGFNRSPDYSNAICVLTLTRYEEELPVDVIFPPHDVVNPLARVISEAGMTQFHCAETEKYPHVTFFLNGGREEPFPGEERVMIPSPKVATYDRQPEMSAHAVADAVIDALDSRRFDFLVVNFANCDMVGHTGDFAATVKAVETVDHELGRVLEALQTTNGIGLVIADHGNAEEMIDRETGGPMTAHTTNPVPCVLVGAPDLKLREGDVLSAVAPTLLRLLGVPVPVDMTTSSLIN